jgi:hypothetical protein
MSLENETTGPKLAGEEIVKLASPPYTPSQRTKLVSDILNLKQEKTEFSDEEWDEERESVATLTDQELSDLWDSQMGKWLLTRSDLPGENSLLVAAIERYEGMSRGEAVVTYQKYKRLCDRTTAGYGFLGEETYHHESDRPDAITVRFTDEDDVRVIESDAGLSTRELQMLIQQIEQEELRARSPATEAAHSAKATLSRKSLTKSLE